MKMDDWLGGMATDEAPSSEGKVINMLKRKLRRSRDPYSLRGLVQEFKYRKRAIVKRNAEIERLRGNIDELERAFMRMHYRMVMKGGE